MPLRSKWYAVASIGDEAEISIFDEIGGFGVSVTDFKDAFDLVRDKKSIKLLLNSPGGSVTDGMAIYNLLASVRSKLKVEVIGLAASMASVVALAGSELVMDEGTYLMIHNPWTITWGDADQLRKDADVLDKMRSELVSIYVAHSGLKAEEVEEMMDAETWLSADEAKDKGFAVAVKKTTRAAACAFDLKAIGFLNPPNGLARPPVAAESIATIRNYEDFLRDAGFSSREAKALASGGWKALRRDAEESEADDRAAIIAAIRATTDVLK